MNALLNTIKEIQKQNNTFTISGKVTEIDESNMTCTILPNDGDAEFFGVRLRASIDDQDTGNILIPKLESQVLISALDNDDDTRFVVMTSEVEKVIYRGEHSEIILNLENEDGIKITSKSKEENLDGTWIVTASDKIEISGSEINLNGSSNGGLIKIDALVGRLNSLENLLTTFIGVFNGHTHVTACTAGGAVVPPTTTQQAQTPTQTQKTQLENDKVKH